MEKINKQILQVAKLAEKENSYSPMQYVHLKDNYIEATDGRILLREYLPTNANKEAFIDYVSETEVGSTSTTYPDTNRVMPCKERIIKLDRTNWEIANKKVPSKTCKEVAILNELLYINAAFLKLIASFFTDEADVRVYSLDEDLNKTNCLYFESLRKRALVCPFRVKFQEDDLVERKTITFRDFADAKKSKAPTQIYVVKDPATGDNLKAFKTTASAELYMIHRGECEMEPVVLA